MQAHELLSAQVFTFPLSEFCVGVIGERVGESELRAREARSAEASLSRGGARE